MKQNPEGLTAAYSGIPGSYAEEAAHEFFGDGAKLLTADSFGGACRLLAEGKADRAVLPVENSTTGAITEVYDLLEQYGFYIVGEQYVKVSHCLLALPGASLSGIREVVSHEQGISQSAEFLAQYPGWVRRPVYNTAAAAQMVAESGSRSMAAIASRRAAECYGLSVLAAPINRKQENFTRFLIVSREADFASGSRKFSILFTLPHGGGSLCRVLRLLEESGMNLVKIESRPMADRNWEYLFFLDFENSGGGETDELFRRVREQTQTFRFLGKYPHAEPNR